MILEAKDISPEFAETFLDKVHLAMSKIDPNWQEEAMTLSDSTETIAKITKLKIQGYKWVLNSSGKGFDDSAKSRLSEELGKLGEEAIPLFLNPGSRGEIPHVNDTKHKGGGTVPPPDEATEEIPQLGKIQKSKLPTQAQLDAGNYKKKHCRIHGLDIAIENPKNSYRSGIDPQGKSWKCKIYYDYGYIKKTKGADGDHLDVFIGPNKNSEILFIVNQVDPKSQDFDEHKVMIGFTSEEEAKNGYLKNYEKNWKGLGSITPLTIDQFKNWLEKGNQKRELIDPEIEFLKSDLARLIKKNNEDILILKSQLALQPITVHGKHGTYIQMRKVKVDNEESKSSPQAFRLQADQYKKPKQRRFQERPKYKIKPEDSQPLNLITNIKNILLNNGQIEKAREFTELAYIAETVQDVYDIADDYVQIEGEKAKHRYTEEDELDLFKGKMQMKEVIKSSIIHILKAKRRKEGETWTQPSGRKVTKKNGKILPVSEGRKKKRGDSEGKKSLSLGDGKEVTKVIKDGFDHTKLKPGFQFNSGGKRYEVIREAKKRPDGKFEAVFKQIESGGKIGELPAKALDESSRGGFSDTSSAIVEAVAKAKKKARNKSQAKQTEGQRPEKGIDIPSSLPATQIRRATQYTDEKDYDKDTINSLKERILENGYDPAFPIMVDKRDEQWTVVAGHHRHTAVEQLIQEGKLPQNFKIPVVTKEFSSDNDRLAAQVSENQRRNVLPTDEAKAYGQMAQNGWDVKKIAEKLGKKPGDINKRLALNNLDPDLFNLVKKKDKALPLGVAETIGMNAKDANGNPSHSMQIRAFKWFVENRSKYPGRGPSVVQSYIKELQSGELQGMDFDSVASDAQKEALRTLGSAEKAHTNKKMIDGMLDSLTKAYQRILGENINDLNPQTIKELAASLTLTGGSVGGSPVLGKLDAVIQDLSMIKDRISMKMKEIEADSQTPMMFGMAKSTLMQTEKLINVFKEEREMMINIQKGKVA